MKIRLEHTKDGHDKYWEFCTIKGTRLSLVTWGPKGVTTSRRPKIGGRQIIKTDDAKRKQKKKMSDGYEIKYSGDDVVHKIALPKNTECMLVFNDGRDQRFVTEVEAKFDSSDVEQISSMSIDDTVTFIMPANNRNVTKLLVAGKLLQFLEK